MTAPLIGSPVNADGLATLPHEQLVRLIASIAGGDCLLPGTRRATRRIR
ncbi:hypothetical protein [Frondihabitans sucicola]|nr:hypothetical protein [Frondihabitans sucicola]